MKSFENIQEDINKVLAAASQYEHGQKANQTKINAHVSLLQVAITEGNDKSIEEARRAAVSAFEHYCDNMIAGAKNMKALAGPSWRIVMQLQCSACGKRFSSYGAEARHRHNFPVYCARNKRFKQWEQEIAASNAAQQTS